MSPSISQAPFLVALCSMPIIFCYLNVSPIASATNAQTQELPFCPPDQLVDSGTPTPSTNSQSLLLVTTVDGQIFGLDLQNEGKVLWKHQTGPGSLISSSISRLEIFKQGQWIRLIPSLDGTLYQFNGDSIEPAYLTADMLLQSSFKLGDDLVVTGGKESRTYGVNLKNGELIYECSVAGCSKMKDSSATNDVLVVQRQTQTVRAVEAKTGNERWNFSVGENYLTFSKGVSGGCNDQTDDSEDNQEMKIEPQDYNIKVMVPEGLVLSLNSDNTVAWSKQFPSSVVSVWKFERGKIEPMNLFERPNLVGNMDASPLLYIGIHQKQLYAQTSVIVRDQLTKAFQKYLSSEYPPARIEWKSEFPAITESDSKSTALTEYKDNFDVLKSGFFLYGKIHIVEDEDTANLSTISCDDDPPEESLNQIIIVSLWHWWKEVLILCITSTLLVNFCITRHVLKHMLVRMRAQLMREVPVVIREIPIISTEIQISGSSDVPVYEEKICENIDEENKEVEYVSRYLTDFEPTQRLGKGGFGVVFEARNKIDDCQYAIKRICLPNRESSREKVMREVKALAKLDHMGIVRYFNAWVESPPAGWIEKEDRLWEDSEQILSSIAVSSSIEPSRLNLKQTSRINNNSISSQDRNTANENTASSLENDQSFKNDREDSFEVVFESPSGNSGSCPDEIILDKQGSGDTDSLVKFEDSGCGENSRFEENKSVSRPQKLNLKFNNFTPPQNVYLYIQMQLCKKETLKDWLVENKENRNKDQILDIFDQLVCAVDYVHESGLMHRDLKPSNIFFSMDGTIKIGDFGLVTAMTENGDHTPSGDGNFVAAKIRNYKHTDRVGTQLYMSPEQINGLSYCHKVDIYSLGLIFFELLVPFDTQMERTKVLESVRNKKYPVEFKEKMPIECALVGWMLAHNPDDRPMTSEIKRHKLFHGFHPELNYLRSQRQRSRSTCVSTSSSDCESSNTGENLLSPPTNS